MFETAAIPIAAAGGGGKLLIATTERTLLCGAGHTTDLCPFHFSFLCTRVVVVIAVVLLAVVHVAVVVAAAVVVVAGAAVRRWPLLLQLRVGHDRVQGNVLTTDQGDRRPQQSVGAVRAVEKVLVAKVVPGQPADDAVVRWCLLLREEEKGS